jgi:HEAT repeat protein
MSSMAGIALTASLLLAALVVLLLLAMTVQHVQRGRTRTRDVRRRAELTPVVHALLDDDQDGGPVTDLASAPALLDDLVLDLLPQLRGSDREALQRVLVSRGLVDRAAVDVGARAAWRRGRAATLLGSAALPGHTAVLAGLLADRSADVRCAAARALGKAGDPAAVGPLLASLSADPALPSGVVGMAVLDLGTPVLPALRAALLDGAPAGRLLAADVLGLHGDPAAVGALVSAVGDREQHPDTRRAAAAALGRIGSPEATDVLARVLVAAPRPALQRAAAEALGRIGDPAGVVALTTGLGSGDPGVRAACADALAATGAEGRGRLGFLAIGRGPVPQAARAALDALALASGRRQSLAS